MNTKKSREYKRLSPKMKKAVDGIFKVMDDKPSDFLNTFENYKESCKTKSCFREGFDGLL